MDRRFFISGCTLLVAASYWPAHASNEDNFIILDEVPPLPSDLIAFKDEAPASYIETEVTGSKAPSSAEMDIAYEILVASPFGVKPHEVANYFHEIATGNIPAFKDYRTYMREWPVRANPVIYHFFSSTQTSPKGDTTPWCAAFVNWCSARAHALSKEMIGKSPAGFSKHGKAFEGSLLKTKTTNSSSSGSFRCLPKLTSPKLGDIVVFADHGTESATKSCLGTGHVAFFHSIPKSGWVRVIGGNQTSPGSGGAVTLADFPTSYGSRFFGYVSPKLT